MRNSDAQETRRQFVTRAEWRRLDCDVQARLWAEVHKDDETKEGKPTLDCQHGNRVGECSLCDLAGEHRKMRETFRAALADVRRLSGE